MITRAWWSAKTEYVPSEPDGIAAAQRTV